MEVRLIFDLSKKGGGGGMKLAEFKKLLDENNPRYDNLIRAIVSIRKRKICVIKRKGWDLLELLQDLLGRNLFPVVDRKLRVVIASTNGHQELIRAELYKYHQSLDGRALPEVSIKEAAELYIRESMGWFISSSNPNYIVAGANYPQDNFDKTPFIFYDNDGNL